MLINNIFSPINFWSGKQHQVLDVSFWCSGKKNIQLNDDANVCYVAVLNGANVDFQIDISWKWSHLEFFGIFVGDVKSQVVTTLLANNNFASVHLFCVVKEGSDMQIDWNIVISKNIEQVEGHLQEEQFLLGTPKHLLVRPLLDVHSHRVKASHWAKIHTLDQQKLFYMMSKGLSLQESQKIVVQAWLQSIFDHISDVDSSEQQKIFKNTIDSIFISLDMVW